MAYEDILAATEFFAGVAASKLVELEATGSRRDLVRGDVVFEEGSAPDQLFVVLNGNERVISDVARLALSNELPA